MKQTGAPGRWKNSRMVNGVDKNNHLFACHCCAHAVPHYLQLESKDDTRCIWDRGRASCLCDLLVPCLNLHISYTHSLCQCWRKEAMGGGRCCSRQLRTMNTKQTTPGEAGVSWIFLPPLSHSYGREWKKRNELQEVLRGTYMQDYRDEKGNTLSSLKIPNSLSISDFYSLVTRKNMLSQARQRYWFKALQLPICI